MVNVRQGVSVRALIAVGTQDGTEQRAFAVTPRARHADRAVVQQGLGRGEALIQLSDGIILVRPIFADHRIDLRGWLAEIGRASCRERV